MKAIKDQVRQQLGPQCTVSDLELNRAYRRFLRYNGPGGHTYYSACKIAEYLKINDRIQGQVSVKSIPFEATKR